MMTRYLLCLLLLCASATAKAQWTPLDIADRKCAFWLDTSHTHGMYEQAINDTVATHPEDDADVAATLAEPIGGFEVRAQSTASAPTLYSDGTRNSALSFNNKNLVVLNSKEAFRFIFSTQNGTIAFWYRAITALASTTETIFDCSASSSGSNAIGFYCTRTSAEAIKFDLTRGQTSVPALSITGPVINDTNWHYVEIRILQGANASYVSVDGTATTGTIANSAPAATTSASYDLIFGKTNSGSLPGTFCLSDFIIVDGALSTSDRTSWLAYNPTRTSMPVQKAYSDNPSLLPNDYSNLYHWRQFTDISTLYTDTAGTTPVASAGDDVALVRNKKTALTNSSWSRDASQSTSAKCPDWATNQINGYGAPVWDGSSNLTSLDYVGENNLINYGWPTGSFTWIGVYKQTDTNLGSHILATGSGAYYFVQTGTLYQSPSETRGDAVLHSGGAPAHTYVNPNGEAVMLVVIRRDGRTFQVSMNGIEGDTITDGTVFNPIHMGRVDRITASNNWDLNGSVYEEVLYNCWMTNAQIAPLMRTMVERYGLTEVQFPASGQRGVRLGLRLGI